MKTYTDTSYSGAPFPTVIICLNIDNNTGTGGSYANCNGMTGIDRSILWNRFFIQVYDGDVNAGTLITTAVANRQTATNVTEVAVDLASLGLPSPFTCTQTIQAAIYFDNGTLDPDDTTPDAGTVTIGCGGPTAVTLQTSEATSAPAVWPLWLAVALLLGGVTGRLLHQRKREYGRILP